MANNPFDQFDEVPVTAKPLASGPNPFDQFDPPEAQAKPVTATNRVHALEGGILGGAAYLGALPLDTVANLYNLGKAGMGAAYQGITGKHGWDVGGPSPVGHWLTQQMDKNPVTQVSPERPDDPASRYLATAGSVVPGVLSGGGGLPATARGLAVAAPAAMAGQAVGEAKPFESDWANNAASIGAQALGTIGGGKVLRPQGAFLPENQIKNDAVTQGQAKGYQFPPATTNPTWANTARETVAGKTNTAQHMAINNQEVTNQGARTDMGLPAAKGAITDLDIANAKALAAPGYDALRSAGQIKAPDNFSTRLDSALARQSGAGRLSSQLADSKLAGIVDDLKGKESFDASDAMDAISALRDKASGAYRTGDAQAGAAYKGVSKVLEDAIDSHLSNQGGAAADTMANFRDSRQKFAIIHSIEENRNPTTGNVLSPKLAAALKRGEYLSGNLEVAARSAGQAEKSGAFAEPTKTAGSHLGLAGALLGGGALAEMLPESLKNMGLGGVALAAAYPASRWATRQYIQGPGQSGALPRGTTPVLTPQNVAASFSSMPYTRQQRELLAKKLQESQ